MANFNLNKVMIAGRLTAKPELKTTQQGTPVLSFIVATTEKYKNGEHTEFVNCVAWQNTAEIISKYFGKGSSIYIEGSMRTRNYEVDGVKKYITEILVKNVNFVDSKKEATNTDEQSEPALTSQPRFEELSNDDDLPF